VSAFQGRSSYGPSGSVRWRTHAVGRAPWRTTATHGWRPSSARVCRPGAHRGSGLQIARGGTSAAPPGARMADAPEQRWAVAGNAAGRACKPPRQAVQRRSRAKLRRLTVVGRGVERIKVWPTVNARACLAVVPTEVGTTSSSHEWRALAARTTAQSLCVRRVAFRSLPLGRTPANRGVRRRDRLAAE
jgi:hypothetical protein